MGYIELFGDIENVNIGIVEKQTANAMNNDIAAGCCRACIL